MRQRTLVALGCAGALTLGLVAFGQSGAGAKSGAVKTNPAFEKMKTLAGTWEGTASMGSGTEPHPAALDIRTTAGGSAIVETEFPGTEHEMVSMIYLDKGDLVLTHYCHLANQPHMKGKLVNENEVAFEFAGGTNFDPKSDMHMHQARYQFTGSDHFVSVWTLYDKGKPAGEARMDMKRKAGGAEK